MSRCTKKKPKERNKKSVILNLMMHGNCDNKFFTKYFTNFQKFMVTLFYP